MGNINEKKLLRKEILANRKNIEQKEKEKMDKFIEDKFYQSKYYKESQKIFIYISFDSEINTLSIINKAMKDGKKIYVPRTEYITKLMDAVEIKSLEDLVKEDRYGILEPSIEKPAIDPNELDLIVVPGVAFDRNGGRMGYGAGYYDRYFKKINNDNIKRITKLALSYDFQVLEEVPMDENDVRIDFILTETQAIDTHVKF